MQSITVANGLGVAPDKPVSILGAAADSAGLCGGGDFTYSIAAVAGATSYTWNTPAGTSIKSVSGGGTQIVLKCPQGSLLTHFL
jgi:hypothetical protein